MWPRHRDAIDQQLAGLRKRSAQERRQAVDALGHSRDPRALQPVIRMLRDPAYEVQQAAVQALARFGPEVVAPLLRTFEDESLTFQENALDVLGQLGDERAIPLCIELLGTPHHHLRLQAAHLLQRFGSVSIQALWEALDHVKHVVRSQALDVLDAMPDERADACLVKALNHPSSYVREKAADLLLNKGDHAFEALSRLFDARHVLAASTVLDMLARTGGVQPLPVLEKALAYPQWQIREKAIEVLGHLRSPGAAGLLARCLADPEPYIRRRAVEMLGRQEAALALEPLLTALRDPLPEIQQQAARWLGEGGDVRAVAPLLSVLRHSVEAVRQEAGTALAKIQDGRAIPLYLDLLHDDQEAIRHLAGGLLSALFSLIDTVVFGTLTRDQPDPATTAWNLESAGLSIPMPALSRVMIQPDTSDMYQVERFLTYAVNSLGLPYLKQRVTVHLYGHPYALHPNLRNNFDHLFKQVLRR